MSGEHSNALRGGSAARGALFLYLQTVGVTVLGYAYWLIISRIAGPEVVGVTSAVAGIASMLVILAGLGVPVGVQRFLGRAAADNDSIEFGGYLKASLLVVGVGLGMVSAALLGLRGVLSEQLRLPEELVTLALFMVVAYGLSQVFKAVFVSTLRTKTMASVSLTGGILRIAVGVALVSLGLGAIGATVGYLSMYVVVAALLSLLSLRLIRRAQSSVRGKLRGHMGEVVRAGSANWVPSVTASMAMQLGVVSVLGFQGAFQAGMYFIALAINSAIIAIPYSILEVMFPVLSGMRSGREAAAWLGIKIGLVFSVPLLVVVGVYPRVVLSLFGQSFADAELILLVLLASQVPFIIFTGVHTLAYANGMYGQVLLLGLLGDVPKIVLYLILTSLFGGLGAAQAYLAGSFTGFAAAVVLARRLRLTVAWRDLTVILAVPTILGLTVTMLSLPWLVGVPLVLVSAGLGYAKLQVVTKRELQEIASGLLPKRVTEEGYQRLNRLLKMLYGE